MTSLAALALVGVPAVSVRGGESDPKRALPKTPAELFRETAVWNIHLTFKPSEWAALEPGGGGFPGGPAGGRGGLRASALLAPAVLYFGGADGRGGLAREAVTALAGQWFSAWDKDDKGALDGDRLRDGLASVVSPARGFGLNLQGPEGGRNGIAAAFGIEYTYVHADLEFEGQVLKDVAVRYKGGGTFLESRRSLKRPLKVSLNHHVKGQKLAGVATLNLANCVTDASRMNEVLAYRLYRDAGVPAPRTAYARVHVTVPGELDRRYLGLYSVVENPDKDFAREVLGSREGAILKPVTPSLFSDLGIDWKHYRQTYDPKTDLTDREVRRVVEFCRLVTYAADAPFAARLGEFVELDELARFMAVMVYLSDVDGILGPGQNLYLHLHPQTNKFTFIPWDQDRSFGQFPMRGTQQQREQLSIHRPWEGPNRFLERLYKVEPFKKAYLARLEEFSKTLFRPERLGRQVDEVAAVIRPMVGEESAEQLARFDRAVAGEPPQRPGGGGPFGFGQPTKPIKPFARVRTQSVQDQLAHTSEGMVLGFGGPGGPGGFGGPGGGPGALLARAFLAALDGDKDGRLTRDEFVRGFGRWFDAWNTDKSGLLTEDQLRAGLDRDVVLQPAGPGFPGRPTLPGR